MIGQNPDTESSIREWLADSAPSGAPASLRLTLEAATTEPAGQARRRFARRPSLLIAGRMVAAVAIAAIAVSTLYLYGQGRPTTYGPNSGSPSTAVSATPSPSPTPADTVAPTVTETPTPTSTTISATITQLPGSSWSLVSGALPFTTDTTAGFYQKPIFALPSGGFVAILPTAAGQTRVFESADGLAWHELASLPTTGAAVSDVIESQGLLVAVGLIVSAGKTPTTPAMVWTFDGRTWDATQLSDGLMANQIAAGPAGLLVAGTGPNGFELWSSKDGTTWRPSPQSGIPWDTDEPLLLGDAGGYTLAQLFQPRVWHSADGTHWTETYRAPALSVTSSYYMGALIKAPDGSFRSFGGIYTGTGIASPPLGDTWIWTSPDMAHWTLTGSIRNQGWFNEVVPVAAGFVAAGTQAAPDGEAQPFEVWTSRDGKTWQPLASTSSLPNSEVLVVVGDGTHAVIALVDGQGQLELVVGASLK